MLKNNIKSLIIHLFISFICLLIFDIQEELIGYRVNMLGYNEKSYYSLRLILCLIIFIFVIFLYYMLSKLYLEKFSTKKNILSVLLVAIIGAILWLASYKLHPQSSSFLKLYYQFYNAYSLPIFNINNSYLAGIFSIIPSFVMCIGIQSKRRR